MNINSIADDIYRATITPRPANFKTTRQKQIDFMWWMYGQGFKLREIGKVYDLEPSTIWMCFKSKLNGTKPKRKYPE